MRTMCRSRWFLPLFTLALGGVLFGAAAMGATSAFSGSTSMPPRSRGRVVIGAVIVGFVVELAHGRDGNPFTWLGALGGIAYLAAIVVMRLQS